MNRLILTALVSAGLAAAVPQSMAQTAGAEGGPQARQSAQRQHNEQRAFRSPTERMQARKAQQAERQQGARLTAIQRMERRQAMLAAASTRLNETLEAMKPLYAALSPEQQKVADEVFAPRGRGGFQHRGGHGRSKA